MLFEAALSNAAIAAVLAVIALAASRWWKHPALAHTLWVLVLVKLVTPPIVHVPLVWPFASDDKSAVAHAVTTSNVPSAADRLAHAADAMNESPASGPPSQGKVRSVKAQRIIAARRESVTGLQRAASVGAVASLTEAKPRFGWTAVLIAGWLAGSALYMAVVLLRVIGFRRGVSKLGRAPQDIQRCAEQVARTVGLTRCPRVVLAPGRVSPMVWGFGKRATVLLPGELWSRLGIEERAALLAHELAHLRRGDPWVRLLELSATAIYWWHPAVWWARRKIHETEEICCDAFVVGAMSGRARAYADALLAAVEFLSDGPSKLAPAASGIAPVETLQRRLTMIMQGETLHNVSIWGRMTLFALAIMLLPMSLTWAEEKNEPQQKQISTVVQATATENADEDEDAGDAEAEEAAQEVAKDIEELIEEIAEGIGEALEEIDGERIAEIIEEVLEAINFEKIGEAIEEALGGFDAVDEAEIEEAVEQALEGLDDEEIEEAIEKALEAVDEEEIEEAIEKALEGLDEAEIEKRVEEALESIDVVDIERQIEDALQQIREMDIGEHIEEALEAIKDADIGKQIEEALEAIREADFEGAIRQALEGVHDEQIEENAERAHQHAEHARERAEDASRQAERARDRGRDRAQQGRQRAEKARRQAERRRGSDEFRGQRQERQPRETRRRADSDPERSRERLERRLQRLERELDTVRRELGELSEKEEQRGDDDSPDEF